MVKLFLPKATMLETIDLTSLLIAQNKNLCRRLWRIFKGKAEAGVGSPRSGLDDRFLEVN